MDTRILAQGDRTGSAGRLAASELEEFDRSFAEAQHGALVKQRAKAAAILRVAGESARAEVRSRREDIQRELDGVDYMARRDDPWAGDPVRQAGMQRSRNLRKAREYRQALRSSTRPSLPAARQRLGRSESRPGRRRTTAPTRGSPDDDPGGEPPDAGRSGDEARQIAALVAETFPESLTSGQFYEASFPFTFGMDPSEPGPTRRRIFRALPDPLARSFYMRVGHATLAPRSAADCRHVDRQGRHVAGGAA